MSIFKKLPDGLMKGCKRPEDLLGDTALMKELKVRLMEQVLAADLTTYLRYRHGKDAPQGKPKRRNCIAQAPREAGRQGANLHAF
jgi:hypothetical protein